MSTNHPPLAGVYACAMRRHVLRLIAEGYARMHKPRFAEEQEPAITGELVEQMRAFLESAADAPSWCAYYSIHDDLPLNTGGRLGKSRLRVDIEFERVIPGPRPRFRFEAKRLCSSTGHSVSGYLGEEGLGCFLSGKYPMSHSEAGMLGYVQSGDESTWADRVASALHREKSAYNVEYPPFHRDCIPTGPDHTYVSHHHSGQAPHATIVHVFLRFGCSQTQKE